MTDYGGVDSVSRINQYITHELEFCPCITFASLDIFFYLYNLRTELYCAIDSTGVCDADDLTKWAPIVNGLCPFP